MHIKNIRMLLRSGLMKRIVNDKHYRTYAIVTPKTSNGAFHALYLFFDPVADVKTLKAYHAAAQTLISYGTTGLCEYLEHDCVNEGYYTILKFE